MRRVNNWAISLAVGMVVAGSVRSADLGTAKDFNVFMLGDMTQSGSDCEGRVAAGGQAHLSNYSIGSALANSNGTRDDLVVQGGLTFASGQVFNGNIAYGSTAALSNLGLPNGTARQASPIDFAAAAVQLATLSTSLSGQAASGTTAFQYGGLTLSGADPTLNVFAVDGANLALANSLIINAPSSSTVLVNVSGTVDRMQNFGFQVNGASRSNVLYHFGDASDLTLSGVGIEGSILAPRAAVHFNSGQINGNLIGASLDGPGESHNHLFSGTLPGAPPSTVPEPSSLVLLGASVLWGSGVLVFKRR